MRYVEAKLFLAPTRDTHNSEPYEIEFTATSTGSIVIDVDGRQLTFNISDISKLAQIAYAVNQ